MTFRTRREAALHEIGPLESWRAAETLVDQRWREYRASARGERSGAFAAFQRALALEATAAQRLALQYRLDLAA